MPEVPCDPSQDYRNFASLDKVSGSSGDALSANNLRCRIFPAQVATQLFLVRPSSSQCLGFELAGKSSRYPRGGRTGF
jgi:hypothetical protein